VLSWVVLNGSGGRSAIFKRPTNYKHPIVASWDPEAKGPYLRLSRLWELAATLPGLFEGHFRERLRPVLQEHKVDGETIADVLEPLGQLSDARQY